MPFETLKNPAITVAEANAAYLPSDARAFLVATEYGATGTPADTATTFRAAIADAKTLKLPVFIPGGVWQVDAALPLPSGVAVFGAGVGVTTVRQMTAGVPVFASETWLTEFGGDPTGRVVLSDLTVRGESTNAASHGVVLRDYYSRIENVHASDCGGMGFRVDAYNQAGTVIDFTCVENQYSNLLVTGTKDTGFRCISPGGIMTDAFMERVIVYGNSGTAITGIHIDSSAGWQISKLHVYGSLVNGIVINDAWQTWLNGAQIEASCSSTGLLLNGVQRVLTLDNISIAMRSGQTGPAIQGFKAEVNAGDGIRVGTLIVAQDNNAAANVFEWDNTSAPVIIDRYLPQGAYKSLLTLKAGAGAAAILCLQDANVAGALRDSGSSRTLTYKGVALAPAPRVLWEAGGAKSANLTVPPMGTYDRWEGIVSVSSKRNYDDVKQCVWVAHVIVTSKASATGWYVSVTDIVAASGFSSAPVVTVDGANSRLSIAFTPTNSDGYGVASLISARS